MKHCPKCDTNKDEKDFFKDKHRRDGLTQYCKKCKTIRNLEYQAKNQERTEIYRKAYQKEYQKKLKTKNPNYHKEKQLRYLSKDINKLIHYQRTRINILLKNYIEREHTIELIGCSPKELYQHIESQFTEGMTWDNYGLHGWHIDHIIPCAFFNLEDYAERKYCFHYTNLQPLWGEENLIKGSKVS